MKMKRKIFLLLSIISAVGAPLCFHYGWLDAVIAFTIIGVLSFTTWSFLIAKEFSDWFDKHNNGFNPFTDF